MAGEWVHCTLADACSAINYGLTASASNDFVGPKFLRITDIVSGQLDWNTVPHVAADDEIMVKYRLYDGDIVIARPGASTGMSTYVKNPPRAVFASYLVRLQALLRNSRSRRTGPRSSSASVHALRSWHSKLRHPVQHSALDRGFDFLVLDRAGREAYPEYRLVP